MSARVLLIGLDAADRDLLLNYAQTGVMPVLGGLLEQGLRGETKMPPGLGVEAMWASFCTGVNPARHGIYCTEQIETGSYNMRPLTHDFLKHEPFWEASSRCAWHQLAG